MKTWGHQDLVAATNADWNEILTLGIEDLPLDLTAAEIEMQVRRRISSADPDLTLTLDEGLSVINPELRTIAATVPASEMARLGPGNCVYDVRVIRAGTTIRVLEGGVSIVRGVTREI